MRRVLLSRRFGRTTRGRARSEVALIVEPRDLWIGVYWNRDRHRYTRINPNHVDRMLLPFGADNPETIPYADIDYWSVYVGVPFLVVRVSWNRYHAIGEEWTP